MLFEVIAGPYGANSEGPAWDGHYIYFSLIQPGKIMRYDPKADELIEWRADTGRTNGLMFNPHGALHACCPGRRSMLRFEADGSTTVLFDTCEGVRLNTPNDLAIDRKGRIWFSNPWNDTLVLPEESGGHLEPSVMRAEPQPDGSWKVVRLDIHTTKPNGVLLSRDEKTLYFSEQDYREGFARELRAYPIHEDGSLGPHTVLHTFGYDHRGGHRAIDGMCLDSEGNILACAGYYKSGPGPMIYVISPTGRILETHPVPVSAPTNCTFGDRDLSSLYVTTHEGHLLRARTNRQGYNLYP